MLHENLVADGVAMPKPEFFGDVFLVPKGETPRLLGQPVALLIYRDFANFYAAKRRLRFDDGVVLYGEETPYNTPALTGPRATCASAAKRRTRKTDTHR